MATDFYIPKTMSPEAQAVLQGFTFALRDGVGFPEPDDLEGWKKIQVQAIQGITA